MVIQMHRIRFTVIGTCPVSGEAPVGTHSATFSSALNTLQGSEFPNPPPANSPGVTGSGSPLEVLQSLARWLAAFDANAGAVRAQGFDERFIRCWRFYLAYCIGGFASGSTDVAQYTLVAR